MLGQVRSLEKRVESLERLINDVAALSEKMTLLMRYLGVDYHTQYYDHKENIFHPAELVKHHHNHVCHCGHREETE